VFYSENEKRLEEDRQLLANVTILKKPFTSSKIVATLLQLKR